MWTYNEGLPGVWGTREHDQLILENKENLEINLRERETLEIFRKQGGGALIFLARVMKMIVLDKSNFMDIVGIILLVLEAMRQNLCEQGNLAH